MNADRELDLVASTTKTTYESYGYYANYGPTTTKYTKVLLGKGDGTFTRGVSSTAGIAGMVGYGSLYDGTGIVTTRPDALSGLTTLGVGEASQVLGLSGSQTALFSGQTVDATTVLVKYTYSGDANLNGKIDVDDYAQIDFNIGVGGTCMGYLNGDFNFDGVIDVDDYGLIDFAFPIQGPVL